MAKLDVGCLTLATFPFILCWFHEGGGGIFSHIYFYLSIQPVVLSKKGTGKLFFLSTMTTTKSTKNYKKATATNFTKE